MTDLDYINKELMTFLPEKEQLDGYHSITEEFEDQRTIIDNPSEMFQLVSVVAPKCEIVNRKDTGLNATGCRRVFFSMREVKEARESTKGKLNFFSRIMKERDLFIKDLLNHYGDLTNVEVSYYQPVNNKPLQLLQDLNAYEFRFIVRRK